MLFKQNIKLQFLPYRKKSYTYKHTHTHTHIYYKINLATLIVADYFENKVKLGEIPSYLPSIQVAYM
jgi:hypothetical protein